MFDLGLFDRGCILATRLVALALIKVWLLGTRLAVVVHLARLTEALLPLRLDLMPLVDLLRLELLLGGIPYPVVVIGVLVVVLSQHSIPLRGGVAAHAKEFFHHLAGLGAIAPPIIGGTATASSATTTELALVVAASTRTVLRT